MAVPKGRKGAPDEPRRGGRRGRSGSSGGLVAALVFLAMAAVGIGVYVAWSRRTEKPAGGAGATDAGAADAGGEAATGTATPEAEPEVPPEAEWTAADFFDLSGPVSPRVAYAAKRVGGALAVAIEVESVSGDGKDVSAEIGLAAAKRVTLSAADAEAQAVGDSMRRFAFTVPAAKLVDDDADWSRLRMGVAVRWSGGALGQDRQRERFRHAGGAPHAGLSSDESDWLPLDLTEHDRAVADRKNSIVIEFDQPMKGKATIVIEDSTGARVRNLVAGQEFAKGRREAVWDGLDEKGAVVQPAEYRWRSIHHPGIRPEYLFSFGNGGSPNWVGWGPNHTCLDEATPGAAPGAGAKWTFLAARVTEGGQAIIALDDRGIQRQSYQQIHGTGLGKVALATDGKHLYVAHDGFGWGKNVDKTKPDWKAKYDVTISRYEVESGRLVDYPGGHRYAVVDTLEFGPGSANPDWTGEVALGGLAHLGGRLYVASRKRNALVVVRADTCEREREITLESPGALEAHDGKLYALSGKRVVTVDPASGRTEKLIDQRGLDPHGLAVDSNGDVYVSDGATHTVMVFDSRGRKRRTIGAPGGPYAGRYVPERLVNPRGIAVSAGGVLWITEDRWNPKRVSAWSARTGRVSVEKFGPPAYGASGGGFDEADPSRWIALGAAWNVDLAAKRATPASVLHEKNGHAGGWYGPATHYRFVHAEGRTFLVGLSGVTFISELKPDGSMRDLAFVGSTHRFCFSCGWNPPREFVEAFNRAYPGRKGKHADKGPGVLWVDTDGDGRCGAREFDFSTECENFAGGYWGHDFRDLTIRVPATVKGKRVVVALEPKGWHPSGAPRYGKLNAACAAGKEIDLGWNEVETATDRFGRMVVNSDPVMKCFSPNGETAWTYPNRWTNVHGSHKAPLPEVGVTQGTLFFLGMTPFDDEADVFMMNGNHGRFFVFTSDGLYLDEMFKDVRLGGAWDAYTIGGECFGGMFGRSAKDGTYYLQSGGTDYRVFRIDGIGEAARASGKLTVTPEQAAAAERDLARRIAETAEKRVATVPRAGAIIVDGRDGDWKGAPTVRWDRGNGRFPVEARAAWDDSHLYLHFNVKDDSPWVNAGRDWTLLFKTGDSVDLQLGTDPRANPSRTGPVPGDLRLLIAPHDGKDVAVLYRHRCPGAADPQTFTCPWRSEKVDSVKVLDSARVAVVKEGGRYRVEAAVALADLDLRSPAGKTFKADFGVLYGDDDGQTTMLRSYWSNANTGLVNDVPGEIMLTPALWGDVTFARNRAGPSAPPSPPR